MYAPLNILQIQIVAVRMASNGFGHEHIVGLKDSTGRAWGVRTEVIPMLRNGTGSFYVDVGGWRVAIKVHGTPPKDYVQTVSDGRPRNNLLNLPRY